MLLMEPATRVLLSATIAVVSPAVPLVGGTFTDDSVTGWSVTPSEAYTWGYQSPQGCSCQATGVSLIDCQIFDCDCVCDLTAGKCDMNCCCDAECTEMELMRFAELNACLPEGPVEDIVSKCYPTDSIDAINPRYPLTGGGLAQSAIDGLLCVQYDNSGSKGEFFEDPGTLATTIFSESAGVSEFTYYDGVATSQGAGMTEGDSIFDKGDRIPAVFSDFDGEAFAAFGGFLPLPVADDTGRCNEGNFIEFGVSVPAFKGEENACVKEVENLREECSSAFGWKHFSLDLYVGKSGTARPKSAIFSDDSYVQVKISSAKWRDWNTGEESDFINLYCGTFYYIGEGATISDLVCMVGGGTWDTITSSNFRDVDEGCKNALIFTSYTIFHDGEGSITSVTAAVILTDIPPGPGGASSSMALSQRFSVEFRLDEELEAASANTRSQEKGNLVERARSGNPGYLLGLPVLAGRMKSSQNDVYIAPGGSDTAGYLELVVDMGQGCGDISRTHVEFGYDGISCCVLTLTRDELDKHCEGVGEFVDPDTGFTPAVFRNTSSTMAYVGAYGNADPLDVSQWVKLSFASSSDTASWDDTSGVCSSLVSILEYRILYASVGSRSNPQNKIISAEARFGKTDWIWRQEPTREQNFLVCNSVSFKMYGQEAQTYTPPYPPVAFAVPWDVFYPFFISTSGSAAVSSQHFKKDNTVWIMQFFVTFLMIFSTLFV